MMRNVLILALWLLPAAAAAAPPKDVPLLEPAHARAIASEISGGAAKRTIEALSLNHRMRGSEGYRKAAELIRTRLVREGLQGIEMISLPADGKIFYGTQRSRPGWNASFAELWEQKQEGGRWADHTRIASWADQPITLAQDSASGRAETELVDIGAGTSASDYAGKDIRGKLVLTSSQPEAVANLAVGQNKATGIISWAQNQRQAWWGEDERLIRWGHLDTFGKHPTFAFMVSPSRARAWQERLGRGEVVRLRAEVKAGREPSAYLIPTAIIPGRERDKEIVFSCHLDHPSPGANDNASGCSGVLEIARSLNRLVKLGALPQPKRTIRFIWPCEIECTIALLNARPEFARRTLATIHLDMIGGNTDITKGTLTVEGSPPSLPSFVSDVGFTIARWVDAQSELYADTGEADLPLLDPEGTKNPLRAKIGGFSEGSDHQIWAEGSWRIPVIYFADWPDIYIHTDKDVPGNIDTTKVKRAAFIAAASAWYLANIDQGQVKMLSELGQIGLMDRTAGAMRLSRGLSDSDRANLLRNVMARESGVEESVQRFSIKLEKRDMPMSAVQVLNSGSAAPGMGAIYRRNPKLKGPMDGFGYSWFDDHLEKAGLARPALLSRPAPSDAPSYGYEALNLVNGERNVRQIRDDLAAAVAPVPLEEVQQYLDTLERLGVIEKMR